MENKLVQFDPIKAQIAEYKQANENLVFDYEDKQGNKDARSHVAKLRKVKTALKAIHKEVKAGALAECQAIDKENRDLHAEVEEMIDVHAVPIKRIEEAEANELRLKAEAMAAEQAAEQERQRKELEEREAALAVKEAEMQAKEDAIKLAADKARFETEQAEREKEIAEEAKVKAEQEAANKIKAAEDAAANAKAQAEADAKAREEARTRAEREKEDKRIAAEAIAADAERRRVEDVKHRDQVEAEIKQDIVKQCIMSEDDVEIIMDVLRFGKIRHLTITY